MFKNPIFAWIAVVIVAVAAVVGWVRSEQMRTRAEEAERVLTIQENIKQLSADMDPATFVSFTNGTVTYTVTRQVERNGMIFVENFEQRASLSQDPGTYGLSGPSVTAGLSDLRSGTPIRIKTSVSRTTGATQIDELLLVP